MNGRLKVEEKGDREQCLSRRISEDAMMLQAAGAIGSKEDNIEIHKDASKESRGVLTGNNGHIELCAGADLRPILFVDAVDTQSCVPTTIIIDDLQFKAYPPHEKTRRIIMNV